MIQPSFENQANKKKSSAESLEASGEIGGRDKEAVAAEIQEKEAVRTSLMKSWKTKFDAIREAKKENDRHLENITRLHATGTGPLTTETFSAEESSMQDKLAEQLRDAQKDLDLANEYGEEIEKLKASIDESAN